MATVLITTLSVNGGATRIQNVYGSDWLISEVQAAVKIELDRLGYKMNGWRINPEDTNSLVNIGESPMGNTVRFCITERTCLRNADDEESFTLTPAKS